MCGAEKLLILGCNGGRSRPGMEVESGREDGGAKDGTPQQGGGSEGETRGAR